MPQASNSTYKAFDTVVYSDIDLPELEACTQASSADFYFTLGPPNGLNDEHNWCHHWYRDDAKTNIESSLAREQGGYRLRFSQQADFLILDDGRRILCEPFPDIPLETLRHLFLDQVIPRILGHQGELIMHASAVELVGGVGIGFVGKSGWGKSTLASSFRGSGDRFLGDDCLKLNVVDGALIGVPAYRGARLWEDSQAALFPDLANFAPVSHYNSKRRISFAAPLVRGSVEFKALFFLEDPAAVADERVTIKLMSGSSAAVDIVKRSFLLDVNNTSSVVGQFKAIGELIKTRALLYSLQYPREYARLPEVQQAIRVIANQNG